MKLNYWSLKLTALNVWCYTNFTTLPVTLDQIKPRQQPSIMIERLRNAINYFSYFKQSAVVVVMVAFLGHLKEQLPV